MRILATLLNPTWGEASVCGYSIYNGAKDIRRLMGYMPDFFGVYDDMKVVEYLEFFAAAYRIQGPERRRKCDQVLDLVDLGYKRDALRDKPVLRGMTQASSAWPLRPARTSRRFCFSTSRPAASIRVPASRCANLRQRTRCSMGKTILVLEP